MSDEVKNPSNVIHLNDSLITTSRYKEKETISGDGGGGGMSDLPRRVGVLETKMDKVQETLSSIQVILAKIEIKLENNVATKDDLMSVRHDLSKDILGTKADISYLKGRVERLPTTGTVVGIVTIVSAILGGLIKLFH
ncbi:hypothetical protein [Swingsia samuiensis]|uniref:Uncharacterized protein n=1 Tax=Swingsia samuiensis TaxID=1293412 RepID=A0A4Y6UKW5_9PROT|nr:hypothetical protein [Swingsia samuiensis]QDH17440.1 hypothetical protein E3D00_07585 [Swingsia samuiensis]